jgi:hypothetical protein
MGVKIVLINSWFLLKTGILLHALTKFEDPSFEIGHHSTLLICTHNFWKSNTKNLSHHVVIQESIFIRLWILLLHDIQRYPLHKEKTRRQKHTQFSKLKKPKMLDNVQNSSQVYSSTPACCLVTHLSSIWKSWHKEQLTQSKSLLAKSTQPHILGILGNIINSVYIWTENRSIHGPISNYKELQMSTL